MLPIGSDIFQRVVRKISFNLHRCNSRDHCRDFSESVCFLPTTTDDLYVLNSNYVGGRCLCWKGLAGDTSNTRAVLGCDLQSDR